MEKIHSPARLNSSTQFINQFTGFEGTPEEKLFQLYFQRNHPEVKKELIKDIIKTLHVITEYHKRNKKFIIRRNRYFRMLARNPKFCGKKYYWLNKRWQMDMQKIQLQQKQTFDFFSHLIQPAIDVQHHPLRNSTLEELNYGIHTTNQ